MLINKNYIQFLVIFVLFAACKTVRYKSNTNKSIPTQLNNIAHILIEAENTNSDLQQWILIQKADKNYVNGASNNTYLEFMGNEPITGKPNSPLEYIFTAPKTTNFQLMLMTSKRLEGVQSDWCNDAFVKLSGDFESASNLKKEDLEKDIKILQDGNDQTPELEWHWASTAEKNRHVYEKFSYQLIKGNTYTLTISGRSQRFSIDYIVLFESNAITIDKAKEIFKISN
jgi:hypothetical protein